MLGVLLFFNYVIIVNNSIPIFKA